MKTVRHLRSLTLATLTAAALALTPIRMQAEDETPGWVDFGKLTAPGNGGQFVEVNLKGQLLSLAARITEKHEPEVSDLLRNLKAIRVNVVGIDDVNRAELGTRMTQVRTELESKGWERIVTVLEKGQDVGVYLKQRGSEAIEGVVVTVIENGKQAVFVNVVGDIRPEKLALLAEHFDIEPLKKVTGRAKKS
jgi:predicted RNA-binding protein with RPS1 domain